MMRCNKSIRPRGSGSSLLPLETLTLAYHLIGPDRAVWVPFDRMCHSSRCAKSFIPLYWESVGTSNAAWELICKGTW
jgi:hypothetical protein